MALFNLSRRARAILVQAPWTRHCRLCIPPLVGLAVLFCYLRRRSLAKAAVSADVCASQPQQPQSDEVVLPPITMRIYDPDDPTTFPSQVTMPSNIEAGSTLANTQPSLPQAGLARGYHGLPIV
ncbi:hypothetical protein BJV77DRAFT_573120 [Russula vinacea]|nr:hypothetical protein BJV77DRAFT_573120 [Russula vinacea]